MSENKSSKAQWLIKTESGQQLGPYPTKTVLKLIADGDLKGLEQIRKYPDGLWISISREPDFYDKILDVLENKITQKSEKIVMNRDEHTIIHNPSDQTRALVPEDQFENTIVIPGSKPFSANKPKAFDKPSFLPDQVDLELEEESSLRTRRKRKILFLSAISVVAVLVAILFFGPKNRDSSTNETSINLIHLDESRAGNFNESQSREAFSRGLSLFLSDQFEAYWEAQKIMIEVSQSKRSMVDSRGLLCLIYNQLWPYSARDSRDLEAIQKATKSIKVIDPIGVNSVYCDLVRLLSSGKLSEAKGLVDYSLNQPQFSTAQCSIFLRLKFSKKKKI